MALIMSFPSMPQDDHREWSQEAFDALAGPGGRLAAEDIRGRQFAGWFRCLLGDMVANGALHPSKSMRTSRVVALLAAKACTSEGLSSDEFDAVTRAVVRPPKGVSVEVELVWRLFDRERRGELPLDAFEQLRQVWSAVGVDISDAEVESVRQAGAEEDNSKLTVQRYRKLLAPHLAGAPRSARRPKASARRPDSSGPEKGERPGARGPTPVPMHFVLDRRCPDNQILRSAEVGAMNLFHRPLDLKMPMRNLEPTHPTERKLPASGRNQPSESTLPGSALHSARERLPDLARTEIDYDAQQEWEERRKHRLLPYMRVRASYMGPNGKKVENAVGTLMSGWGCANKCSVVPHARAPEAVQKATAAQRPHHFKQVAKLKDKENFVLVLINGVERLVPRDWVSPASEL